MIQIVLTVIIIAIAAGIAVYRLVRFVRNPLSHCDGCASDCSGCAVEELKKDIENNKKYQKSNGGLKREVN